MSLFDLEPLPAPIPYEARHGEERLSANGQTIMRLSSHGPGGPVWRTVRHRPWWQLLGPGPVGETCAECQSLHRRRHATTYFKCGRQAITSGAGTDIRASDPACRFFQSRDVLR